MTEADDPQSGESRYLQLPWQLVGGLLLALLVIALGAGLYANQSLRQQMTIQPTATEGPAPTRAPVAAAATPVPPTATLVAPTSTTVVASETATPGAAAPQPTVITASITSTAVRTSV